ncbi:PadR family transcriptional regulator [Anaerosolibacter sp.]|uniref:PadR family transcriptional regulator n=1 Tax=Anaerosolibacter sp. TaxID=1872527 RepID=UPI0039EF282E
MKKNLNEPSLYILLSLNRQPLNGYAITREVMRITEGRLEIKTGTMYPTLNTLSKQRYIELLDIENPERNKKTYRITDIGRQAIEDEMNILERMLFEIKTELKGGPEL